MNHQAVKVKPINLGELTGYRRSLPSSWTKAAGLLRHKRKALECHLKKVRSEWETRRHAAK